MRDGFKELMTRSFRDAMDVVADYNEWCAEEFDQQVPVPPQAVPQIALTLYQSRVHRRMGDAGEFDLPEFDDKMYE